MARGGGPPAPGGNPPRVSQREERAGRVVCSYIHTFYCPAIDKTITTIYVSHFCLYSSSFPFLSTFPLFGKIARGIADRPEASSRRRFTDLRCARPGTKHELRPPRPSAHRHNARSCEHLGARSSFTFVMETFYHCLMPVFLPKREEYITGSI